MRAGWTSWLALQAGAAAGHRRHSAFAVDDSGGPWARAAVEDGAAAFDARADKEAKYAELVRARRCALVVVAIETGGRWSQEAAEFVRELAHA